MADFSKQYCDLHDPKMPSDFDILQIAEELEPNHYTSMICEGFGFIAIGKTENNEVVLAVPTGETITDENGQMFDSIIWEPYEDIVK